MATAQARLTPRADTQPAVVRIANELSGAHWCARFPGEDTVAALAQDFQSKFNNFKAALDAAGINISIGSVYRPKERAFLMHHCAKVARGTESPSLVPQLDGVNIEWDHGEIEKSKAAAQAMASRYGIVYPPAYPTFHSERTAIDITLSNFVGKTIKDASGVDVRIQRESDLYPVGSTYGVIKLVGDPPHWSENGR